MVGAGAELDEELEEVAGLAAVRERDRETTRWRCSSFRSPSSAFASASFWSAVRLSFASRFSTPPSRP